MSTSRWMMNGAPTRCAYCGEPFKIADQHMEAYRVGDEYVCNEFCAEGLTDQPPEHRRKVLQ